MSAANARRLAWALAALALALAVAATAVSMMGGSRFDIGQDAFVWAIMLVFTVAGHLIATRKPGNAIGWLFLGVGVSASLGSLSGAYAGYWLDTGAGSDQLGRTAAWYGELSWMPFILVPATFLLLLFPDGHLLTRRWRPVAWAAAVGIALNFVAEGTRPGAIPDYPELRNPYGVDSSLISLLQLFAAMALVIGMVGSATSVVVRFRRARGEERQQMKWIAFAGAVAALTIVVMTSLYEVAGEAAANATMMLSIMAVPVATAVAIVRHRLYDIDVVINRTLVYGSLTATLAAVYVGSVLLLQLALSDLTQGSGLAVAASTLAVAALFRPARGRIQSAVDRSFFRSRYDATRTIELFGARLRDEVELAALSADLEAVVRETMRPAHVSLWLRDVEGSAR
jgi:hypothetical protein